MSDIGVVEDVVDDVAEGVDGIVAEGVVVGVVSGIVDGIVDGVVGGIVDGDERNIQQFRSGSIQQSRPNTDAYTSNKGAINNSHT
tara:strand:+ start:350 stop:604 length:255 start_codon:yes stop_codon:yes gene_type:complete